jgi:hypothetical protein
MVLVSSVRVAIAEPEKLMLVLERAVEHLDALQQRDSFAFLVEYVHFG